MCLSQTEEMTDLGQLTFPCEKAPPKWDDPEWVERCVSFPTFLDLHTRETKRQVPLTYKTK
jgi:hypothetical protein